MKRIMDFFNKQLHDLWDDVSKPISNTLEFIIVCTLVSILRFILTGTTLLNDLPDLFNAIVLTFFSFIPSYYIHQYEEDDEQYSVKDLLARLVRIIVYSYVVFITIW